MVEGGLITKDQLADGKRMAEDYRAKHTAVTTATPNR